jgi:predicted nucleic acid-binding protein
MTVADALYVSLAEVLGAHLLTADNKLVALRPSRQTYRSSGWLVDS